MAAKLVTRSTTTESLRLGLLGGFRLSSGSDEIALPLNSQRVVCFVALSNHSLRRTFVSGSLWGASTDQHAGHCLRSALWRLRDPSFRLLTLTSDRIALADDVTIDVRESETLAHRVLDPSTDIGNVDETIEKLLAEDLLPDWTEDWVLMERESFHQLRLRALEALCRRLTTAGRVGEAVQAGIAAVSAEPLRESSRRALVAAHIADGNYAAAVREFDAFSDLLQDELGLDPSPKMRTLIDAMSGAR